MAQQYTQVSCRLSSETLKWIDKRAEKNFRSRNQEINFLIEKIAQKEAAHAQ